MRKHPFINGSYYHIYNRGRQRDVFINIKDVEKIPPLYGTVFI